MFSSRTPANLTSNRLGDAIVQRQRAGRPFIDLTESNPTRAGLPYPVDLLASLADSRGLRYAPQALGSADARAAVAADYGRRGLDVSPDHIVLTASTSDAYSLLFKLLADPGDEILVPRPSYPLFEHLTRLDAVRVRPYSLEYHGVWTIDAANVERALTARTRALMVVSPNNPTGSFVKPHELDQLAAICAAHDIAIIADEVFADYTIASSAPRGTVASRDDVLAFALGGLSKSAGLPQVKLGWMAVGGPEQVRRDALDRLELICDSYLSVSTPVQVALPALLAGGASVREAIQARVRANFQAFTDAVAREPSCTALVSEGGWYAVVQVPSYRPEEELVLDLLESDNVLAHPGYFFDFARESFLVVSLLTPEAAFAEGMARLVSRAAAAPVTP